MKALVISVLVLMAVGSLTSLLWLGAAAYSWWRDRGLDPDVLATLRLAMRDPRQKTWR